MATYSAESVWEGDFKKGKGHFATGSKAVKGPVSYRLKEGEVTNPEELTGAALGTCYMIVLAKLLQDAGYEASRIKTAVDVRLDTSGGRFTIPSIALRAEAMVPEIDQNEFQKFAQQAEAACPVSKALSGTDIQLEATVVKT